MGLFGKSFEEKVREALNTIRARGAAVEGLNATVDRKVVTLTGTAATMEDKARVMQEFNALIDADNTINQIRVVASPAVTAAVEVAAPEPEPEADEQFHEVVRGDTLGAIAQKYYGKAGLYPRIFEANRDQLDNPDLIKVGQKLRIPKL